ncbi:hypothetical protein FHU36_000849 [Nonomuraea muscovyensis]|uniref:Uncharacterized protein n=1 Tax=Nonomuraea muscovyensis TaxID=1124761 RepID=A0A7X0BYW3_9ACTN|nr:hypothetical protein [Nonomuraea muscovyensis]MBB6344340.1 hypothetical protein [Nonomuraea muscovyensis]
MPIILEVPPEVISEMKVLTFESDFDQLALKLREEAIRRFATGLEIPGEVLLGMGDINHWGAWALQAEAIRLGIEPRLATVAHALTTQWLRPLLEDQGVNDAGQWLVWYDTSPLRVRQNRSQTALEVYDRGAISAEALRRETGFDDSDAPRLGQNVRARETRLPVDETTTPPDTLPASAMPEGLLAAADGLIWGALSAAGEKLRRTPACPRSERARAKEMLSAALHTILPVEAVQVEQWRLLEGAWARVPEIAARYGLDAECLTATLDSYCRELIAAGVEHRYEQTSGVLRAPCVMGAA